MSLHWVISVSLIFLLCFSLLPLEIVEELELAKHRVKGFRCMYYIFRSFHVTNHQHFQEQYAAFYL